MPLQRRITDFGADLSFGQVNKKLQEHYGITVSTSAPRVITLDHAKAYKLKQDKDLGKKNNPEKLLVISETDGCMVPIVQPKARGEIADRRKGKVVLYREARLTLAHEKGSARPVFSGTMGDVKQTGLHIQHCVRLVGIGKKTFVHCVGDGATWISEQIEEQFGNQARYLVDFYHLCEYLAAASARCALGAEPAWMERQKNLLKENQAEQVLLALSPFIEDRNIADNEAPVRVCYRYLSNRLALNQLDYKTALANDLPIGSGEIESAHRYVIQKRLKVPGAWWLEAHAEQMLALRVARANDQWESHWRQAA